MERDQLLEGAALVERGFVEAPDHDVCDVGEPVRAKQVLRSSWRERRERVRSLDASGGEVVRSLRAEHDGSVVLAPDQ